MVLYFDPTFELFQRGTLTVDFDIFKIFFSTDKRKQLQKLVSSVRYL